MYATAAKSLQLCQTLRDPIDGSPPGTAVPGSLQARVLEWGAIAFSDSTIKKNEILSFAATWMDLESVILSKISQTRR